MNEWKMILVENGWIVERPGVEMVLKKGTAQAIVGSYGVHINAPEKELPIRYRLLEWSPTIHSLSLLAAIAAEDFNK